MSRWLEAARAASMPVQLAQKGAVSLQNADIWINQAQKKLTDPNCTNCTRIKTETEQSDSTPSKLEICGQCAIIVKDSQEFLNIVADGFPGVIHLDCYDAWFEARVRGRYS